MAYAVLADLKLRLGSSESPPGLYEQLTDRVLATTGNDTVGQECLDSAEALVNRSLAKHYAVPVDVSVDTELAKTLRDVTVSMAVRLAYERNAVCQRMAAKFESTLGATKRDLDWLATIADGTQPLPGAVPAAISPLMGDSATAVGSPRVFTDEAMRNL